MLLQLLAFAFFFAPAGDAAPKLTEVKDQELYDYVIDKAARITQLPRPSNANLPKMYWVSKDDLATIVCPENPYNCRGMAAVFDDIQFRILIREDLTLQGAFDYSFAIHEYVHALQYLANGPFIFKDCATLYKTEEQAYRAQDVYLREEGEFYIASVTLKFFYCDETEIQKDFQASKEHWDTL